MEDLVNAYVDELKDKEEFKRLLALKKYIDNNYSSLIVKLKNKEAKYLEAKQYPNQYDVDKAQREFSEAKAELYSKEEVKEYFKLERFLNELLNDDINELKESISNKFTKEELMKI